MYKESYNFHVGELIDYYTDIWNGEKKVETDFANEFVLSLLKLDTLLTRMKYMQDMPELDTSLLNTDMIKDSFINAKSDEYFRPEDYQIHFLVYSLLKHNDIANQNLIQIIDGFFKYRKVRRNLKFRDIERTGTGSVRCKTNLRFAIFQLRSFGLINYHEKSKRSWSLTLPGFLIAIALCVKKGGTSSYAFGFDIRRMYRSYYRAYGNFDVRIVSIVNYFCKEENLNWVFDFVDDLSPDKNMKQITRDIFLSYRDFLIKARENNGFANFSTKKYFLSMNEFMQVQKTKNVIDVFKAGFSDLINADRFFNELIGSVIDKEN